MDSLVASGTPVISQEPLEITAIIFLNETITDNRPCTEDRVSWLQVTWDNVFNTLHHSVCVCVCSHTLCIQSAIFIINLRKHKHLGTDSSHFSHARCYSQRSNDSLKTITAGIHHQRVLLTSDNVSCDDGHDFGSWHKLLLPCQLQYWWNVCKQLRLHLQHHIIAVWVIPPAT